MTVIAVAIIDADVGEVRRHDQRVAVLARLPNCVMYCSATRSCTASSAAGRLNRLGDAADAFGGGGGHGEDRRRLALGLVDLLLLAGLGRLDHLLLLALGRVDGGVALRPRRSGSTARFSRSARICFSIAARMSCGGVMFLIS